MKVGSRLQSISLITRRWRSRDDVGNANVLAVTV
jgi:hypothetical protein